MQLELHKPTMVIGY